MALCKRNDIRAMTNAAMADALRALPKVEGIEEYVKVLQPVAVPETAVESENEEQKLKKPERPLPRGRRATAKSSEPIVPEEDTEKLEDAKRQSNKEDAQAPGVGPVGQRGVSRRARPVPAVPLPSGKAVAEEDGQEDNLKREAKRDNAPAPVLGRCGASRRGRPLPAVAAPAAESDVAGAEEERIEEVVEEDLKREAIMDDAPALGVGRRGAKQRARPASSVAALALPPSSLLSGEAREPALVASLLVLSAAALQQPPSPRAGRRPLSADADALLAHMCDPRGAHPAPHSWCHTLHLRRRVDAAEHCHHHHWPVSMPLTPPGRDGGGGGGEEIDVRYGVAKRLVPTGPNPLHN